MITEGKAKINVENPEKISKKLRVFYNPVMKLNRDVAIKILKIHANKTSPLRIALPLAGSGIRGVRFLLEAPEALNHISFNDMSRDAVKAIGDSLITNKIYDYNKIYIYENEANHFLLKSHGFDYIDIDPFGSPNAYLDAASQRISRGGILAITATDTAPLSGTYPKTCKRNYDAKPMRNEFKHIAGLRILIRKVQLIA